jgi:hypothetical protein
MSRSVQFSSRAKAWSFSGVKTKRIFKYTIDLDKREQTVLLPEFAEVLSAQVQRGDGQIWALVDTDEEQKPRKFFVFVTGAAVKNPERLRFVDTLQLHEGSIVLHVFEQVNDL